MKNSHPQVYVIAGPNGAGKTTFAREFLPLYAKCRNFVNADLIALGIAPFSPQTAAIKAGRLVLEQIRDFSNQGVSFAFESTLSGKGYIPLLKALKSQGYTVHIYFLWISSVDLALDRIKRRVARGGHTVPTKDVRRRYIKSLENFRKHFSLLTDHWYIMNNSSVVPKPLASCRSGQLEIFEPDLYERIFKTGRRNV